MNKIIGTVREALLLINRWLSWIPGWEAGRRDRREEEQMVRLGEVVHAWKMLDATITDYMLGLADGAEVAKIQRYTRDLIEHNR